MGVHLHTHRRASTATARKTTELTAKVRHLLGRRVNDFGEERVTNRKMAFSPRGKCYRMKLECAGCSTTQADKWQTVIE